MIFIKYSFFYSKCTPYTEETQEERFLRLADYYDANNSNNIFQKLRDNGQYGMLLDLKIQGYRSQGLYGDTTLTRYPDGSNLE